MLAALIVGAVLFQDTRKEWNEFPAFVWRSRYANGEPPAALIEGFGGIDLKRDEDASWASERGYHFYIGHGPGRNDLHIDADRPSWKEPWDAWYETRDEALLVRDPCLSDESTTERLKDTLNRTIERDEVGLFISLGDEMSMTPSQGVPWDGCRSPSCRARWGDRAMPTTDEVRLAWTAGSTKQLGAWLSLRRFHRGILESALGRLSTQGIDPWKLNYGVLGTVGANPFGGLSIPWLVSHVDVIECYPQGDARADLETLRGKRTRSLLTVFLQDESPAGVAWQASEHWVRGGNGVVIWNDALLEDHPEKAAALRAALAAIRKLEQAGLTGPVLRFPPPPTGPAVLRDDDSRALAFLADARVDGKSWPNRFPSYQATHGTVELAVEKWLRYFEDSGLHPGVVRFGSIDPNRFPVVVLPHVLVVGEEEAGELRKFLEAGGVLLLEGDLGSHDREGRPRSTDLGAQLAREYPEQVVADLLDRYLARRLNLSPERRRELLPATVWANFDRIRNGPVPITSDGGLPWLVTRRRNLLTGAHVYTAIPNLVSTEERTRLAPARIRPPEVPPRSEIRWMYPEPDADGEIIVPAGHPLVFEIATRR